MIDEQPTARSVRTNNDQTNDGASAIRRPSQDDVAVNIENDDTQFTDTFIERCLSSDHFNGKLKPSDIKLSSAMAMSAAAVSPYLGKNEEIERQFTHILTVCGIEMAANTVYDMDSERDEHCCGPVRC